LTDIHNPPNFDLPPLKINQSSDRQTFEANQEVKALIDSNLLLDAAFSAVYMDLFAKTKELRQLIVLATMGEYNPWPQVVRVQPKEPRFSDFLPPVTNVTVTYDMDALDSTVFEQAMQKAFEKRAVAARQAIVHEIIKLSNEMQNTLFQYGQNTGRKIPILSTQTLYICQGCNRVVSIDWFQAAPCKCGKSIASTSDVIQVSIKCFSKVVVQFLAANLWLEYGIAHLFRQKNATALVGRHVLGHSGVWHEIDVIAESKQHNQRIFGECKNAELKGSDVFVLLGKMIDIGCTRGYLFTTGATVHQDISRLSKSKNISVVQGVLGKTRDELLDELKDL